MRILEIVSGRRVDGAVMHGLLLCRHLARRGHAVTLMCRPESWIGEQPVETGLDVARSELRRIPTNDLREAYDLIRHRDIDVVHTHMSSAHAFGALLKVFGRVPCVATAHNCQIQPHWVFNDRVIAVSRATARFQRRINLVRRSRVQVIPNFIELERFDRPAADLRRRTRESLGISSSALVLGNVGRVVARKGIIHLVRMLARVTEFRPDVRLLLVGMDREGIEYVTSVRTEARQRGVLERIHFVGHQSDIAPFLAASDVYVHGALHEPFGMAIVEAMAMRLPVVATNVGGVGDVLRDGEYGRLVPPADPAAMAMAVMQLVAHPDERTTLGRRGADYVRREHTAEAVVPRVEAVLQEVVEESCRRRRAPSAA